MKSLRVALLATVLAAFATGTTVAYAADVPAASDTVKTPKKTKKHKAKKAKKAKKKQAAPAASKG